MFLTRFRDTCAILSYYNAREKTDEHSAEFDRLEPDRLSSTPRSGGMQVSSLRARCPRSEASFRNGGAACRNCDVVGHAQVKAQHFWSARVEQELARAADAAVSAERQAHLNAAALYLAADGGEVESARILLKTALFSRLAFAED